MQRQIIQAPIPIEPAQDSPPPNKAPAVRGLSLLSHLILYALLISIPMLGFGAWMISHYSNAEREAMEQKARWHARDVSQSIEHELRRVADQLTTLSQSRSLAAGELAILYRRAAHAASVFKGIMIVRDAHGQQLVNTRVPWGTPLPTSNLPVEAYPHLSAGNTYISNVFIGALGKMPVVTVTIPIIDGGKLTNTISMSLDPGTLLSGLGIPLPPKGWTVRVLDRQSLIIASTAAKDEPGRSLNVIPTATLRAAGNSQNWGDDEITSADGKHELRAYHRSTGSGWTVAVTIPFEHIEGPFAQRWQALASAGAMLLALSTLLAIILANDLVRQFQLVAQQASALVRGETYLGARSNLRDLDCMREVNSVLRSLTAAGEELSARTKALRDSEAQLRAVFEGSPIGMFRADLLKNCTYANPRLCDLANTSLDNMVGHGWMKAMPPQPLEQLVQVWDAAAAKSKPFDIEIEFTSVNRRLGGIHAKIHAVPELDADGRMIGFIGTVDDITSRKRAEAAAAAQTERFKRMLLATPDVVYMHEVGRPEMGFLNRNLGDALGLTGRDGSEISFAEIDAMIHADDRPQATRFREEMRHARDGEVRQIEIRLHTPDPVNPDICVLVRSVVFSRNDDGSVQQVLGIVTDITARKEAEARLAEEIEKFKRMTLASPDIVYLYDRQAKRVTHLNRSLREVLGYERRETNDGADDMYEFIHPEDIEGAHAHVRAMRDARDGEVRTQECRFRGPDGSVRWMQNRSVVFSRHPDGRVHLVLGVATDTTERNLAAEALTRSNAELEEKVTQEVARREQAQRDLARAKNLEAIGRLTGGVAHDFNNVLTIIMGSLRLFRSRHKDQVPLTLIQDALDGAESGRRLIQQLLYFAKRQRLDPVPINLGEHIGGVIRWIRATLPDSIEVRTNFAPEIGRVLVDEAGLDSAVINLVMNASDAMADGGVLFVEAGNIHLATSEDESPAGDFIYLAITDTGTGVAPDIADRIFEPFFTTKTNDGRDAAEENGTADAPSLGSRQGSGLGLSSVFGFVKQSHGRIEMRSAPGQGTCFILYFPRSRIEPPVLDMHFDADDIMPGGGATVLVVDDFPKVRQLMVETLQKMGYQTLEAETGRAARALLSTAQADGQPRIDAVLSDVVMPGGVSGPDLAHWIEDNAPEIAVVLMSGYDDGQQATAPAGKGPPRRPIKRISKPATPRQISSALHEALTASAAVQRPATQPGPLPSTESDAAAI